MLKYLRIVDEIERSIESGALPFGQRLPSVRVLAWSRNVSVATVVQAYQELESLDIIEARPRSGYYVSRQPASRKAPAGHDPAGGPVSLEKFNDLMPDLFNEAYLRNIARLGVAQLESDLIPVDELRRHSRAAMRLNRQALVGYPSPEGHAGLRRRICDIAQKKGIMAWADDIVVTNGCQEALWIAFSGIRQVGDTIAVESPCYPGTLKILQSLGFHVVEIPADRDEGLDTGRLRSAIRLHDIAALYVMPNCSNPQGFVYPESNKDELMDIARSSGLTIIEDDSNRDLCFRASDLSTLKARDDSGQVIFCSSFSKTVSPAMRIGWMISPPGQAQARDLKYALNLASPIEPQIVLERFIADGGYRRQVNRLKGVLARTVGSMKHAVERAIPDAQIEFPRGGTFLWVKLGNQLDSQLLRERALENGVSIAPGPLFSPCGEYRNFMRVGWGGTWCRTPENAIRKLGNVAHMIASEKQPAGVRGD